MAQIFRPRDVAILSFIVTVAVIFIVGGSAAFYVFVWSSYVTQVGINVEQPIGFSHEHHVGEIGIHCRYCHSSVMHSSSAGMPPTRTCLNCHSYIWKDSPKLALVHESWETGEPIPWNRVHDLPDFVFFNHSIHVHKGVGCETCHGRVDQMPRIRKVASLYMKWCLNCHRNPAPYLRPRDAVFQFGWDGENHDPDLGAKLMKAYHIREGLTECYVCHR